MKVTMLSGKKLPTHLMKMGGLTGAVVIASAVGAVGLAALWLKAPMSDLIQFFLYLLLSGGLSISLVLAWIIFSQRLVGLRLQLTVAYLAGAVITMLNIMFTSGLMCLNVHGQSILSL